MSIKNKVRSIAEKTKQSRKTSMTLLLSLFTMMFITGPALAGSGSGGTVGGKLCKNKNNSVVKFINEVVPLAAGLLIIGAAILAYLLHTRTGLSKDPEQVQFYKNWRNRAAFVAVSTPVIAYLMDVALDKVGLSIAKCINLFPF